MQMYQTRNETVQFLRSDAADLATVAGGSYNTSSSGECTPMRTSDSTLPSSKQAVLLTDRRLIAVRQQRDLPVVSVYHH
jgi:hypothetical protein